jgi:UrcA family protein
MFKSTPIAAALLGLALTATPAFAKDVEVRYADLDLASTEGQKILETRIARAAREACDYEARVTGSHLPSPEARACYRKAVDSARTMMAAKIEAAQEAQLGG